MPKPIPIIIAVRMKLNIITLLIEALAKGFLPRDSTVSIDIRPKAEKPMTKDEMTIINTNRYLRA